MAQIPATVTIPQLPQATTLTLAEVIEAVQTTGGVANSVQIPLSSIATTLFGNLPQGGVTGQILEKTSGTNFVSNWVNLGSLVTASTGIGISGSTALAVSLASTTGLSVLGVTGTANAAPAAIIGTADQVLLVNHAGTAVNFGAVNLATSAAVTGVLGIANGGTNTSSVDAFGAVYANGSTSLGVTAAGLIGQFFQAQGTTSPPTWVSSPVLKIQNFTASGTYTASSGLLYALMFTVGGGGGGGGVTGLAANSLGGGGGGSGGFSIAVASAAGIGVSQTVTIGAGGVGASGGTGAVGGTTSIGVFCMGRGGAGGLPNNGTSVLGNGGLGGASGTGSVAIVGALGGIGGTNISTANLALSGNGGASFLGDGAAGVIVGNGSLSAGNSATVPGGGGAGGAVTGTTSIVAGGAGAAGQAFVIELTAF